MTTKQLHEYLGRHPDWELPCTLTIHHPRGDITISEIAEDGTIMGKGTPIDDEIMRRVLKEVRKVVRGEVAKPPKSSTTARKGKKAK